MKRSGILFFLFLLSLFLHAQRTGSTTSAQWRATGKPQLIRGPYLQAATPNSVIIRWRTDVSSRSRVSFGTDSKKLDRTISDIKLVTEHQVQLTDLKPSTKYYYSIGALKDTIEGNDGNYFITLPVAGTIDLYRIGVFGDCGYLSVGQANVRDQFISYLGNNYMNAWLLLGDNAYNDGTDAEYQAKFFNVYRELLKRYPMYPSPGNHDYHDADFTAEYAQNNHTTAYYQNFSMPVNGEAGGVPSHNPAFYSFDIGNIHFLSLDSYGKEENQFFLYDTTGPQMQWVKKDLEANQNKQWIIAYTHFPPYSMTTHNSDTESGLYKIRENVVPILERYGVDLLICGHSHGYERSRLLNGYYGKEVDFNTRYNVSNATGVYDGGKNSEPYIKNFKKGTMYVVSGSSSYVGKADPAFPHDAMYYSNDKNLGAGMLEINGNRLDFKWICEDGVIRDQFTMMKDVNKTTTVHVKKGESATLTASFVCNEYKWSHSEEQGKKIIVKPLTWKSTYTVTDKSGSLKDVFVVIVDK
jgi:hypothetical protein